MERFVKGEIVVVPFPFSDLTKSKKRPALVLADLIGDDVILCQITSQKIRDLYAISLSNFDLVSGGLNKQSNVRPNRIFAADKRIILKKVGRIKKSKYSEISSSICKLISNNF